jgi:hypothetical protein
MNKLQTVLDALLNDLCYLQIADAHDKSLKINKEAIAIIEQMMRAEPVHQHRVRYCADWYDGYLDTSDGKHYEKRTLYAAPQAVPSCPDCKAPDLLYECIHCSASNYPAAPKVAV